MENLYIYRLEANDDKIDFKIWKDVKQTRKGEIVTKKDYKYKLEHQYYKKARYLNEYRYHYTGVTKKLMYTEYISFERDVNINKLLEPFIQEKKDQIQKLEQEIKEMKNINIKGGDK